MRNKVDYYLDLWDKERQRLGIEIDDLFVTKENGKYVCAKVSTVNSFMETCSNLMDLDIYSHSFRHYYTTYLLKMGVDITAVRDLMGHEDTSTTEIYSDIPKEDNFLKYFSENGDIIPKDKKGLSDL